MTEPSRRVSVEEIDTILGHAWPVLDAGFVRVVDYMGCDAAVVQAARVSYGEGTKKAREDAALIRYLMRHRHTTPFEMCEIKLHVKVPMDCWRQWIRHRTASVNEYSTRYSVAINETQSTDPREWRVQSAANRQGSLGYLPADVGRELSEAERAFHAAARALYEARLAVGVAREQARKDLPLSTYTEAYWKTDLHNLLHFLALRMDSHAQPEIRAYATTIGHEIVRRWCPVVWSAFLEYKVGAMQLSGTEIAILRAIAKGDNSEALEIASSARLLHEGQETRELKELNAKLSVLSLTGPWTEAQDA